MSLFFSRLRELPFQAALLVALASLGVAAPASAQQTQGGAAAGRSLNAAPGAVNNNALGNPSGSPLGKPMGEPMGSPLGGAQGAEPLQRSVDAARQPVGGNADNSANPALRMDSGQLPAGATAAADGPQPLNSAATVGVDYKIGPSDLLDFDVFGVPDMARTVRVNASGVVSLPLVGPVRVAGLTTARAEALIAQKYAADYLQNPQVSLFIKEFTSQRITIEGAVAKPGIYPVTGQLTLLRALALAGGGGQYALLNEVMLFRSGSAADANTEMFDLEKIRTGEVADPVINADDVIVVKRDPKRTALRDSFFGDLLSTLNPFK